MNKEVNIYLAGKIKSYDWRFMIADMRNTEIGTKKDILWMKSYVKPVPDFRINIVGPFFISCDHRCYHGENQHGVGANNGGCMGHMFSPKDVLDISSYQIQNKADVLFAYIEDDTCYGTIAEIGYAYGIHKPIAILWDNENLREDMWFIDAMSDISYVYQTKNNIVLDMKTLAKNPESFKKKFGTEWMDYFIKCIGIHHRAKINSITDV